MKPRRPLAERGLKSPKMVPIRVPNQNSPMLQTIMWTSIVARKALILAEREGFEPSVPLTSTTD